MIRYRTGVYLLTCVLMGVLLKAEAALEPRDILMTLGDMEYASDSPLPDGWYEPGKTSSLSYSVALDSSVKSRGQRSVRFACQPATEWSVWELRRPTAVGRNGLKAGDTVTVSADVRTGALDRARVILLVDAYRDSTRLITAQAVLDAPTTGWRTLSTSLTVPDNATLVGVSIAVNIQQGGSVQFWVDNVRLTNGEQIEVPVRSAHNIGTFALFRVHPDIYETARRYKKVILAPQNWILARPLRYYNPHIEVYVHFSAVSTISHIEDRFDTLGYQWVDQNRPRWFLLDNEGNRIQERDFPGAYLVDIGNNELQQRWLERVRDFAQRYGFTGVVMDNVVRQFLFFQTTSCQQYPSADAYHAAMTSFLQYVSPRLQQAGLKVGANFGEPWSQNNAPYSTWMQYVQVALTENWVRYYHRPTNLYGFYSVSSQIEQVNALDSQGGLESLIQGRTTEAGTATRRYLLGMALLNANSRTYFNTAPANYEETAHYLPDCELSLGGPQERFTLIAGHSTNGGVWRRRYENGLVLVNTHPSQQFSVSLEGEYLDANGTYYPPGTYTLMPRDAFILVRPANLLQIAVTPQSISPKPGETVVVTVTIRNGSQQSLSSIWVRVPVPSPLHYVPGTASDGGIFDASARWITWVIDTLVPGAQTERRFRVTVP